MLLMALGIGVSGNSGVNGAAPPHGCSEPSAAFYGSPPTFSRKSGTSTESDRTSEVHPGIEIFDSFDGPEGSAPDRDKWNVIEGAAWDRGIQEYASGNAVLDGHGHLALRADKTDSGYTSGRVETRRKASFGYGILIARIKMPSGTGLWPAFWLLGADEDFNPWPGAGEIDVVEMVSDPRTWYTSLHGPVVGVEDYLQDQISGEGPDMSAEFHDYWVIRAEDKITVGIDETVWGVFTPDSLPPTARWVYNKPFCLIFNLAVGGDWAGQPDKTTKFPATMLIDWVHWKPA